MDSPFRQFAELCDQLAATTRKLEKRALLANYLKALPVEDAARAALYFSGKPFAETDHRTLNVGGALLSKAVAQISGADRNAMHTAYRKNGDLGAAASDLMQENVPCQPVLTLLDVEAAFTEIAAARGPAPKLRLVLDLFAKTSPIEIKYLIKLITGDMRIGVKQSLVEEAVAFTYNHDPQLVRRAVMLTGSLSETVQLAATNHLEEARMQLFHALGFMLASPVASVEEAIDRFTSEIIEEKKAAAESLFQAEPAIAISVSETSESEAIHEAQLEDKYDGVRAQLHCGSSTDPGRVALYSRNREDIGESFPEIIEAFAHISEPAILDGEIVAWNPIDNRALPFTSLQQRLGRKRVSHEMRRDTPVVFVAFDLLYHGKDLLLDQPLVKRRQRLEAFATLHAETTKDLVELGQARLFDEPSDSFSRLILAPAMRLESAEQLDRAYTIARERGNEGVMLKALHSTYQPGRRGLAWLKLKRELATLDVVVTGAEYGHGRRAGVLSDYTFAVRDGENLKNIGKAYSGLTDAEIDRLTKFLKEHTLEDSGYFRTVEPLIVLEVAFNNIMRSTRHDSGFALRFPRIVRIRDDKPISEIDTLERAEEIYNAQPDKPEDS